VNNAYNLLVHWKQDATTHGGTTNSDGVAFANVGQANGDEATIGDRPHITCFKCGAKGHYADQCTETKVKKGDDVHQSGASLLTNAVHGSTLCMVGDDRLGKSLPLGCSWTAN
jgi:hypothetical protein